MVSRLKVAEWNELVDEFSKFAAAVGLSGTKKRNIKKSAVTEDKIEEKGKLMRLQ